MDEDPRSITKNVNTIKWNRQIVEDNVTPDFI